MPLKPVQLSFDLSNAHLNLLKNCLQNTGICQYNIHCYVLKLASQLVAI